MPNRWMSPEPVRATNPEMCWSSIHADPGKFLKSNRAVLDAVTGIYSTKPGTVGRRQTTAKSPDEVPMAMMGIVPTKVTAENGPIKTGDLLVVLVNQAGSP